ncbi:MAG: ABC transporter permease, partial [Pedobacter sp.]
MNKTSLIIKREYLTRVRKRTFIISTLLLPLLWLAMIFGTSYLGEKGMKVLKVALVDSSGLLDQGKVARANAHDKGSSLVLVKEPADSIMKNFAKMGYDGYLIIPANTTVKDGADRIILSTEKTVGTASSVQGKINSMWNEMRYEELGIDSAKKSMLKNVITITPQNVHDKAADSGVAKIIGMVSGFLMYFILLIYGSQVMMGVMEEKTNRIAEVMVSSVKPFHLMLGKIVGIGLVALTQFVLWIVFILAIYNITKASGSSDSSINEMVGEVQKTFSGVNLPLVLFAFAFYFLGGFMFYSSLYA